MSPKFSYGDLVQHRASGQTAIVVDDRRTEHDGVQTHEYRLSVGLPPTQARSASDWQNQEMWVPECVLEAASSVDLTSVI